MPYGTAFASRYRWRADFPRRADCEPEELLVGVRSITSQRSFEQYLAVGGLIAALSYWPVTLGLLVLGGAGLGIEHLLDRAQARARSRRLAADARRRRSLRRRRAASVFPPPSPEALLVAWERSRDSLEERILLGSLVADLEPAVDASYRRDADGTIVGRAPGIRGWLADNAPELVPHYKALMAYKRLAERFRLVCGLDEPGTAEQILPAAPHRRAGRPKAPAKPRAAALSLLSSLPRPTIRALDDELHRRLGLVRRRRGPRRRIPA